MTDTLVGLAAAVVAAGLFGVAAVLQAHGVRQETEPMDTLREFVSTALRNRLILAVVAAYLAGFVLHAVSIWYLPLYLAQSAVALSLPVTALSAARLRERLGVREWSAVLGIVVGLVLVSFGSGDPGAGRSSPLFALLLWVGVVLLLGFGFRGRWLGAGAIGAVAGLGVRRLGDRRARRRPPPRRIRRGGGGRSAGLRAARLLALLPCPGPFGGRRLVGALGGRSDLGARGGRHLVPG